MIYLEHISYLIRDSGRVDRDTSLLISGNRIAAVGRPAPDEPGLVRVDCRGRAVMPGLVNAHTHLWQLLLRGRRDDLPLGRWCDEILLPAIGTLKSGDPRLAQLSGLWMRAGICEMLRCGVTSFADMDLECFPLGLGRACEEMGVRGAIGLEMADFWYTKDEAACRRTRDAVLEFAAAFQNPEGRVRAILAPSEPSMCSPELLAWTAETADRLGLRVQIHVNETRQDVLRLRERTDRCAMEYLDSFGLLSERFSAVHCVHATPRDIALAAQRGISVVYNPKSNMKLGSGVAPIPAFLRAGVNVSLATDGPASNDTLDMTEELRVGVLLQKAAAEDPEALGACEAFRMATAGGAAMLGLDAGVLDEGRLADLVIVDLGMGNLFNDGGELIPLLVYCLRSENIESVMVDGRFLLRERSVLTCNEETVHAELRALLKSLRLG